MAPYAPRMCVSRPERVPLIPAPVARHVPLPDSVATVGQQARLSVQHCSYCCRRRTTIRPISAVRDTSENNGVVVTGAVVCTDGWRMDEGDWRYCR